MAIRYRTVHAGVVLVLALLMTASVLGLSLVFGTIIINEIRQSRLIDQSMQAYYFAESGAEHVLYQLRKREAVIGCETGQVCNEETGYCDGNPNGAACLTTGKGSLDFLGVWNVAFENELEVATLLQEGGSFQLDLYGTLQGCPATVSDPIPGVEKIVIKSSVDAMKFYGQVSNLSWLACSTGLCAHPGPGTIDDAYRDFIFVTKDAGETEPIQPIDALAGYDLSGYCSYGLRLTYPLNTNSPAVPTVVRVSLYDINDQPIAIPSRIIIESDATFGDSYQKVMVRTPVRPPLSGLYDFVLFSEQEIVK